LRLSLGVLFGGLANASNLVCRVGVRLLLHSMYELRLRFGGGESSELHQPSPLIAEQLVELLLAVPHGFFAVGERLNAFRRLAFALLQQVVLAIELALVVVDPALLALDLLAAAADLDFPFLAEPHQLFLAAEDGGLTQAFRFALRFADDSLGGLF